jgi:imidazolonepropionase-like amidohydrolase
VGSLEAGKEFDAVVLDGSLDVLLHGGAAPVRSVIKGGRIVHETR